MSKLQRWKRRNWNQYDDIRFTVKTQKAKIQETQELKATSLYQPWTPKLK